VPLPAPSGTLVPIAQPPEPGADQLDAAELTLANPINKPITDARELDRIIGDDAPPSLEALQNTHPNDEPDDDIKPGRREQLQETAHIYGAQGGLAARSFAINEMLRRYEPTLDATFDFRPIVLPIGGGHAHAQMDREAGRPGRGDAGHAFRGGTQPEAIAKDAVPT